MNVLLPIPRPRRAEFTGNWCQLPAGARVVSDDPRAAEVLAADLRTLTGWEWPRADVPRRGDVVLDPAARDGYELDVGDTIRITGDVGEGGVTVLQLLERDGDDWFLPAGRIDDAAQFPWRALMVDVARLPHTPATLRQLIALCRWYKIPFLQLHLTDIQAFTFPVVAYPTLASAHNHIRRDEWRALVDYGAERGVTLIPELDVPGHANSGLRRLLPTDPHNEWNAINPVHPDTEEVLGTILAEMAAVFHTSPYLHIGGDELAYAGWKDCRMIRAYRRERGFAELADVYREFIGRLHRLVRGLGRQTIAWEGFGPTGAVPIPPDILVQAWETFYCQPEELLALGHRIVNASWGPLYVVGELNCSVRQVYQWQPFIFGSHRLMKVPGVFANAPAAVDAVTCLCPERWDPRVQPRAKMIPPHKHVLGGMMCSWQQPDDLEIPSLRRRLAAMSERTWNPAATADYPAFLTRLERADERLDLLLLAIRKQFTDRHRVITRRDEIRARRAAGEDIPECEMDRDLP